MKPSKVRRKKLREEKRKRDEERAKHVNAFVRLDKAIKARAKNNHK